MNFENPTPTTPEKLSTMIEMPAHISAGLAEAASTQLALDESMASERRASAVEVANTINDTRPEGVPSSLPNFDAEPEYTELTASTVRSKVPTFPPSPR
jgi:hypothetical protein